MSSLEKLVLLDSEDAVDKEELRKRMKLAKLFADMIPREAFENLSVLQPSVGCHNRCSFCSQESGGTVHYLDKRSVKLLIASINAAARLSGVDHLGCSKAYKPRVIFPYLDNDIGSYPHLDEYMVALGDIGLKARLSTVGWPRDNIQLSQMHGRIIGSLANTLDSVRFSLNPFPIGKRRNHTNFMEDFVYSARTYLSLFDSSSQVRALIDICIPPDLHVGEVAVRRRDGVSMISSGEYALYVNSEDPESATEATLVIGGRSAIEGTFVQLSNDDGIYYGFIPSHASSNGNGVFFYPGTPLRVGGVLDARWPLDDLRALYGDAPTTAGFIAQCHSYVRSTCESSLSRGLYLERVFLPLANELRTVFDGLGLPASRLLDESVLKSRGVMRNSGRAHYAFKGIASNPNIMVVPNALPQRDASEEVWRVFPVSRYQAGDELASHMGKKSRFSQSQIGESGDLFIAVCAVDPPTHSNECGNGGYRRRYFVPVDGLLDPLTTLRFSEGVTAGAVPGMGHRKA
ncbi:MAG: hypothetical protein IKE22_04175 [Atopobiaceae bacterium]|nr:hypothetical protein [Atopobiaceae bacterium]